MINSPELRQYLLRITQQFFEDFPHFIPATLSEGETNVETITQCFANCLFEQMMAAIGGKKTYQGIAIPCQCGSSARFVNYRTRKVVSLHGEANVSRAYYHCSQCHTSQTPWDEKQGLNRRIYTPRTKAHIANVMALLPYRMGCKMLENLTGFTLQESTAEEIVAELGGKIREEEEREIKATQAQALNLLASKLGEEEIAPPVKPVPSHANHPVQGKRLYISLDGVFAHLGKEWHEVKCGIVYTARSDEDGKDALWESAYTGAREPAEAFGCRLSRLAAAWSVDSYGEVVAIADGAHVNWNLFEMHFPTAIQILDFMHASQHLSEVADAYYGSGTDLSKAWWQKWSKELKERGSKPVQAAIKLLNQDDAAKQAIIVREYNYFVTNAHRMDYPCYIAKGLMIGSGPIEATCKVLVSQRFKQAGMRWSDPGAEAVLAIRARVMNSDEASIQRAAIAA